MANAAQPDPLGAKPADAATPYRPRETVGDLLKRTRQGFGSDIDTVADTLRIRAAYLAAIEQGRYDRLPGAVYALGFVRTYALHLGLDGDEAVRRFKQEAAGLDRRRDLAFPMALAQRSLPGGRMLLAALILALCFYGAWSYLSTGSRPPAEHVAAVPANLLPPAPAAAPAAPAPVAATAPGAAAPAAAPPPASPSAPITVTELAPPPPAPPAAAPAAPGNPASAAAPPPQLAAVPPPPVAAPGMTPLPSPLPSADAAAPPAPQPAADQPPPPPAPRVFGAVDGPSHITVKATQDCWIQVRESDAAQTVIAQRTLHAGDTYRVPDQAGLYMRTGYGTGLEITVDGKRAPPLGGTVHRNVALDSQKLLAGAAIE